jgi:hypothetical protein
MTSLPDRLLMLAIGYAAAVSFCELKQRMWAMVNG